MALELFIVIKAILIDNKNCRHCSIKYHKAQTLPTTLSSETVLGSVEHNLDQDPSE